MSNLKKCNLCHKNVGGAQPYTALVCGHTLCFQCDLQIATFIKKCPICFEPLNPEFKIDCQKCSNAIFVTDSVLHADGTTYHRHCFQILDLRGRSIHSNRQQRRSRSFALRQRYLRMPPQRREIRLYPRQSKRKVRRATARRPEEPRPQESRPEESRPEESRPEESMLEESRPEESMLEESMLEDPAEGSQEFYEIELD